MAYYLRRRKRRDGSAGDWQCIHHRPHPSTPGKRVTASKTFPTKKDATAWGVEQDHKYNRNPTGHLAAGKTAFATLVEQWEAVVYPRLAPRSRARYEQVVRHHLMPEFGGAAISTINRQWVRRYLAQLQAAIRLDGKPQHAPGTVHKVLTTLTSIMTEAVESEMVEANPCRDVRSSLKLRDEKRKVVPLTSAEVDALAAAVAAKHPPYGTLIRCAAFTGLRASELAALRVRDVDLLRGELHVRRALKAWNAGQPVMGTPKTKKSMRTVVLIEELGELLAAHIPAGAKPDDLVFTSSARLAGRSTRWRSSATTSNQLESTRYPIIRVCASTISDTRS